jgi:hypothetical protein
VNEQACILWKKRRTVGWLNLSLAARGAAEGIVVALDELGELRLGRYGLPGLAVVLGRPWAECAPAVDELLEAGRFVVDEDRGVLFDPQQRERLGGADPLQELALELARIQASEGGEGPARDGNAASDQPSLNPFATTPLADRMAPERVSAPTRPSTARSRRHRALKRSQLQLPGTDATEATPDATVQRVACVASPRAAPETARRVSTSAPDVERCLKVAVNSPSLSDLRDLSSKKRKGVAARDVVQRDATLPDDLRGTFLDACAAAGVDLAADFVWAKFTPHAHSKRWRIHEMADRWRGWMTREIDWTLKKAEREERRSRPGLASSAITIADRERWELEAQASRPARLEAAAKAMALFS